MPLLVNIRHLERHSLELKGEVATSDLDLETNDEMVHGASPLTYNLEVELLDRSLLVRGHLQLELECRCVRCLKAFKHMLSLRDWTSHIPLAGEESAPVRNDCVDLTPFLREDILLEFPQHPLCKPGCRGIDLYTKPKSAAAWKDDSAAAWSDLDKLNL